MPTGITPLLAEQEQDGRDQRPRVADADPPHEINDVERPGHGNVVSPDADARGQQVGGGIEKDHEQAEGHDETAEPAPRRAACQDNATDLVGDGGVGMAWLEDRRAAVRKGVVSGGFATHEWALSGSA